MTQPSFYFLILLTIGCASKTGADTGTTHEGQPPNNGDTGYSDADPGLETGSDDGEGSGGESSGGTTSGEQDTEAGGDDGSGDGSADGDNGSDGSGDGSGSASALSIAGTYWNEDLASTYTITESTISEINGPPVATTYIWNVGAYHNGDRYIIAQNPADHVSGPGWTRYDWAVESGILYLCPTVTDAPDDEAALGATPADSSAGFESGCDYIVGWMKLTPS